MSIDSLTLRAAGLVDGLHTALDHGLRDDGAAHDGPLVPVLTTLLPSATIAIRSNDRSLRHEDTATAGEPKRG